MREEFALMKKAFEEAKSKVPAWMLKTVKNTKTGNMVQVRSLPPEEWEKYRPKKDALLSNFSKEYTPSCNYNKRDNCGPSALDFLDWADSKGIKGLKRMKGYFKADSVVHDKADFTKEMKKEFLASGMDFNSASARKKWLEDSKYADEWKRIPHYWVEDGKGNIYDPSGQGQIIKTGLAKDLSKSRYQQGEPA